MDNSLIGLAVFAFAASITPGPNNLMLMASGANFGLVRSMPHWAGVVLGFALLLFVAGLGAGALILGNPVIETFFRLLCGVVILWLGWKIARARRSGAGEGQSRPLTFIQASAFQWINPKAWVMALSAISLYAPGSRVGDIAVTVGVFMLMNLPSTMAWLVSGEAIQRLLHKDAHFRAFNIVMALLLVGSSLPMLLPGDGLAP